MTTNTWTNSFPRFIFSGFIGTRDERRRAEVKA